MNKKREKRGIRIKPKYIRIKIYVKGLYQEINECAYGNTMNTLWNEKKIPIDFQSHNFQRSEYLIKYFFSRFFHITATHIFYYSHPFIYFLP